MDYSKMGGGRSGKNTPRHDEHNRKGGRANPFGTKDDRQSLVERMKAAAEARKAATPVEEPKG